MFSRCAVSRYLLAVIVVAGAMAPALVVAQDQSTPADAPVLNLQQCIDVALDGSISLAISGARRESAEQDVLAAWGGFLPAFNFGYDYNKSSRTDFDVRQTAVEWIPLDREDSVDPFYYPISVPTDEISDSTSKTTYKALSVNGRLTLFDGLRMFSNLNSAKSAKSAAAATEGYEREIVVQNVTEAYFNLLRYEHLLKVAEDSRELAARELERSETYFRLGSVAKSEVLQARVRLEQTKLEVSVQANLVAQTFASLAYHMNQPLAARFGIDQSAMAITDFPVPDPADLYANAMINRLDLVGQEYTLAARNSDVTTAAASLYPTVDMTMRYSKTNNESEYRWGAQQASDFAWGVGVTWSGLVFDRLVGVTNRSRAKANQRIAEYTLDQARLDAQVEIRMLANSLMEARNRVTLSRETIVQTKEELRLAQERFRVGAGTALDRITAEVNLATARGDEVKAICDFLIASAKLDRAVGRLHGATSQ